MPRLKSDLVESDLVEPSSNGKGPNSNGGLPGGEHLSPRELPSGEGLEKIPDVFLRNGMVVPIDSVIPDPLNARLHPERNKKDIRESILKYGQIRPIVVQESSRKIVAGNGTWGVLKSLGWQYIAASIIDLTDEQTLGYGVADNRAAESAKWDFQVLAQIDAMLLELGDPGLIEAGWRERELDVIRMAEWTPPPIEDGEESSGGRHVVAFLPENWNLVEKAVSTIRETLGEDVSIEKCITYACEQYASSRGRVT